LEAVATWQHRWPQVGELEWLIGDQAAISVHTAVFAHMEAVGVTDFERTIGGHEQRLQVERGHAVVCSDRCAYRTTAPELDAQVARTDGDWQRCHWQVLTVGGDREPQRS